MSTRGGGSGQAAFLDGALPFDEPKIETAAELTKDIQVAVWKIAPLNVTLLFKPSHEDYIYFWQREENTGDPGSLRWIWH